MPNPTELDPRDKTSVRRLTIARLYEMAKLPPESTRGTLTGQIKACKLLYQMHGEKIALQLLGELANIAPSRTNENSRNQQTAGKLLQKFLKSINADSTATH